MEKIGYVYLTTNLVNGKQYVGQHLSAKFDKRYKGFIWRHADNTQQETF